MPHPSAPHKFLQPIWWQNPFYNQSGRREASYFDRFQQALRSSLASLAWLLWPEFTERVVKECKRHLLHVSIICIHLRETAPRRSQTNSANQHGTAWTHLTPLESTWCNDIQNVQWCPTAFNDSQWDTRMITYDSRCRGASETKGPEPHQGKKRPHALAKASNPGVCMWSGSGLQALLAEACMAVASLQVYQMTASGTTRS